MVEQEEIAEDFSDDEVDQKSHTKLLSAVSRIYKKQRVDKPKRSEPYTNVSEYHLSNYDGSESSKEKIQVFDLIKVLDRKTSHQKIKSKFVSVKDKSAKLPKPLEKVYEDKIKRSVGYEHLKQHVSRWNEVVQQNRTATQLSFPLNQDSEVKVYKPLEFLHTFKEPTELEKNMAEVLQQSSVAQLDSQVEEAIFNLSIPEMIEKRKLMAKLKAKESYQIVKAMKQNKIKSKKYRRILRKEKLKQELKNFETLQRTDPEAALEKLNKIEKERAEERASLRHRNTGKWARGQAIRAKYDIEARKQLAEQISKSRELTQKRRLGEESSSEEEVEDEEEDNIERQQGVRVQDDNPWTKEDQEKEETVEDFIAGYQNYWKNNKPEPKEKPKINKAALSRLMGKSVKDVNSSVSSETNQVVSDSVDTTQGASELNSTTGPIDGSLSDNDIEDFKKSIKKLNRASDKSDSSNKSKPGINKKLFPTKKKSETSKVNTDSENLSNSPLDTNNVNVSSVDFEEVLTKFLASPKGQDVSKLKTPVKKKQRKKFKSDESEEKSCITNISGSWEVTPEKSGEKVSKRNENLDDLFNRMEGDVRDRVRERLKKFEETPEDEEEIEPPVEKKKDKKKESKSQIKISEVSIISESTDRENVLEDKELEDILKTVDSLDQLKDSAKLIKEPEINPNQFLNVKPRILNAQVPDMLTEGDAILDDSEDNRRLEITEAFAEDDVVEEFRKQKEDEVKESGLGDVDLFLPGWGSWGGPCTNPNIILKKKKRFFIKAPEIKRKDSGKPNVIINEDISQKYKTHLVSDVPYPFTSVRDFEASIRAPVGSSWVPETAVNKLTKPPVLKKLGTVIEPMKENYLIKNKRKKAALKVNNFTSKDGSDIK